MRRRWLTAALAGMAAACAAGGPWQAPVERDHALVGRIWDVAGAAFIDADELLVRLGRAQLVLLGEKHDHPDHHRLQARIIRGLSADGRRPVVALEMLTPRQEAHLSRHREGQPDDVDGIAEAVDWAASGWPAWSLYRPLFEAVIDIGLEVRAASLARASVQRLMREGLAALGDDRTRVLGLNRPLDVEVRAAMARDIERAHCGQAPDHLIDSMITVQRVRDAVMAEILSAAPSGGGVLIAGAQHVRIDRGIPVFAARSEPAPRLATLALVEVRSSIDDPSGYREVFTAAALPFDYVWFTPAVDAADPCEKFINKLKILNNNTSSKI